MSRHKKRSKTQLMLPFFMDPHPSQRTPELVLVSRPDHGADDVLHTTPAVPASEEIPEVWLQAMPPAWRARLEARAELTGAMNLWTLSAVTGIPTWRLRSRLEQDSRAWMEFSDGVDTLAKSEADAPEPAPNRGNPGRAVSSSAHIELKAG